MNTPLYITLRTLLEHLSRKVIVKRRLPPRFGNTQLFVSPGSMLKLWWPNLTRVDPSLFDWASEFVTSGDVVWDLGANVGLFSFACAGLVGPGGRVLAVEADIWLADLLQKSARGNVSRGLPVDILPVAVGAAVDVTTFNIATRGRAANYLAGAEGSSQAGGVRETRLVVTVTIDWLLQRFPHPTVIKIDVEGAEDQVLAGATRLLSEVRPVLLCEVADQNKKRVSDLLHAHGYTLFDLNAKSDRKPIQTAVFNTLAQPPVLSEAAEIGQDASVTEDDGEKEQDSAVSAAPLARDHGVSDIVNCAGRVPYEQLHAYLSGLDLPVMSR